VFCLPEIIDVTRIAAQKNQEKALQERHFLHSILLKHVGGDLSHLRTIIDQWGVEDTMPRSMAKSSTAAVDGDRQPTVLADRESLHRARSVPRETGAMTNPFDVPSNHRLLAAESALTLLYGETGLMGVTAEMRDEAVNRHLVSQGKARVSRDTIRRAMRRLRKADAADK
jgi:hypothetical protein